MTLNKTQKGILDLTTNNLEVDITKETKEFIENLELKLGVELNKDEDSNIYILTEGFIKEIVKGRIMFLSFLANLNNFFDSNKFEGYNLGNYLGLRNALLDLNIFKDCKIEVIKPGIANIIILPKEEVNIEKKVNEIVKVIHNYIAIGIQTYENKEDKNLITGKVNASNGQELEYGFYIAQERTFKMKIIYYLNYEDSNMVYDMVEAIEEELYSIYNKRYKKIGKDIKIQDFYSMVIKIAGLGRVSIELTELNEKGEEIKRYKDEDIKISNKEIFTLSKLEIIGSKSESSF